MLGLSLTSIRVSTINDSIYFEGKLVNNINEFIPGLELCESFYQDVVRGLFQVNFPRVTYSAALIGTGSEVLGFDTPMSTDHNWGPRMQIFIHPDDYTDHAGDIDNCLRNNLPYKYKGYLVNFNDPDPNEDGTRIAQPVESGQVNHLVEVTTIESFLIKYLGMNPLDSITSADWLTFLEQVLLELTSGKVFHDGLHTLGQVREMLKYYPRDVWLYKMASQWKRIAQEEPFIGRCGDIGDELGSRVVASRLVRDIIRLCFLQSRRYVPYSKWLGTAFAKLACSKDIMPSLINTLSSDNWQDREKHICEAYITVAKQHNELKITVPVEPVITNFHNRPFKVIDAERFTKAIRAQIEDELIKNIKSDVGGIDQFVDSTDVTSYPQIFSKLRSIYG
jgi:hypothetical protein